MGETALLSLPPWGLRLLMGIGAGFDDGGYSATERCLDLVDRRVGVLDGVMEQPGDGHVFVATRLEDERRRSKKVSDVRDVAAFAALVAMCLDGKGKCFDESGAEVSSARGIAHHLDVLTSFFGRPSSCTADATLLEREVGRTMLTVVPSADGTH